MSVFSSIPGKGLPLSPTGSFLSFLFKGFPFTPKPGPVKPASLEKVRPLTATPGIPQAIFANFPTAQSAASQVTTPSGHLVVPTAFKPVDLGDGLKMEFDPATLAGRITPALSGRTLSEMDSSVPGSEVSYNGSDVRLMIEVPHSNGSFRKQLLEATTISLSTHRVKSPVRACGYKNPKGFARGGRTIAGTFIMTQFTVDVFFRFLQEVVVQEDAGKDWYYSKPDQIPPFNLTMICSNEQGFSSFRRLLGIDLVTDGTQYSHFDQYTEQQITFYAADVTPLMPLTLTDFMRPASQDPRIQRQRTVEDVLRS